MAGKVFVSYRRGDGLRLFEELLKRTITLPMRGEIVDGEIIREPYEVEQKIENSEVLVVIIGPLWVSTAERNGLFLLESPGDPVSTAIESAFDRDIAIVPCLVGGATVPIAEFLPKTPWSRRAAFEHLVRQSPITFEPTYYEDRMAELVLKLESILARSAADELAQWHQIEVAPSVEKLVAHLERFPSGATSSLAQLKFSELSWEALDLSDLAEIENFIFSFPQSRHSVAASERAERLRSDREMLRVRDLVRSRFSEFKRDGCKDPTEFVKSLWVDCGDCVSEADRKIAEARIRRFLVSDARARFLFSPAFAIFHGNFFTIPVGALLYLLNNLLNRGDTQSWMFDFSVFLFLGSIVLTGMVLGATMVVGRVLEKIGLIDENHPDLFE